MATARTTCSSGAPTRRVTAPLRLATEVVLGGIEPGDQDLGLTCNGFGVGEDGEIYICGGTVSAPGGAGNILRIAPVP